MLAKVEEGENSTVRVVKIAQLKLGEIWGSGGEGDQAR